MLFRLFAKGWRHINLVNSDLGSPFEFLKKTKYILSQKSWYYLPLLM
jgi:hypothetical protein